MAPRTVRIAVLALVLPLAGAATANAQVLIKVSDDVNFKLGVLGQFQMDTVEDPPGDANSNNLFIRRLRLMFAGQVAKKVTFFMETDTPNLGKAQPPTGLVDRSQRQHQERVFTDQPDGDGRAERSHRPAAAV